LLDGAIILSGPGSLVGHLIAPQPSLTIAFGQSGEGAASPEGVAHIANGSFHASFLVAGADLTRLGCEVVMSAEFEQAWIEKNVVAAPL
jgi:hypothetical protein